MTWITRRPTRWGWACCFVPSLFSLRFVCVVRLLLLLFPSVLCTHYIESQYHMDGDDATAFVCVFNVHHIAGIIQMVYCMCAVLNVAIASRNAYVISYTVLRLMHCAHDRNTKRCFVSRQYYRSDAKLLFTTHSHASLTHSHGSADLQSSFVAGLIFMLCYCLSWIIFSSLVFVANYCEFKNMLTSQETCSLRRVWCPINAVCWLDYPQWHTILQQQKNRERMRIRLKMH